MKTIIRVIILNIISLMLIFVNCTCERDIWNTDTWIRIDPIPEMGIEKDFWEYPFTVRYHLNPVHAILFDLYEDQEGYDEQQLRVGIKMQLEIVQKLVISGQPVTSVGEKINWLGPDDFDENYYGVWSAIPDRGSFEWNHEPISNNEINSSGKLRIVLVGRDGQELTNESGHPLFMSEINLKFRDYLTYEHTRVDILNTRKTVRLSELYEPHELYGEYYIHPGTKINWQRLSFGNTSIEPLVKGQVVPVSATWTINKGGKWDYKVGDYVKFYAKLYYSGGSPNIWQTKREDSYSFLVVPDLVVTSANFKGRLNSATSNPGNVTYTGAYWVTNIDESSISSLAFRISQGSNPKRTVILIDKNDLNIGLETGSAWSYKWDGKVFNSNGDLVSALTNTTEDVLLEIGFMKMDGTYEASKTHELDIIPANTSLIVNWNWNKTYFSRDDLMSFNSAAHHKIFFTFFPSSKDNFGSSDQEKLVFDIYQFRRGEKIIVNRQVIQGPFVADQEFSAHFSWYGRFYKPDELNPNYTHEALLSFPDYNQPFIFNIYPVAFINGKAEKVSSASPWMEYEVFNYVPDMSTWVHLRTDEMSNHFGVDELTMFEKDNYTFHFDYKISPYWVDPYNTDLTLNDISHVILRISDCHDNDITLFREIPEEHKDGFEKRGYGIVWDGKWNDNQPIQLPEDNKLYIELSLGDNYFQQAHSYIPDDTQPDNGNYPREINIFPHQLSMPKILLGNGDNPQSIQKRPSLENSGYSLVHDFTIDINTKSPSYMTAVGIYSPAPNLSIEAWVEFENGNRQFKTNKVTVEGYDCFYDESNGGYDVVYFPIVYGGFEKDLVDYGPWRVKACANISERTATDLIPVADPESHPAYAISSGSEEVTFMGTPSIRTHYDVEYDCYLGLDVINESGINKAYQLIGMQWHFHLDDVFDSTLKPGYTATIEYDDIGFYFDEFDDDLYDQYVLVLNEMKGHPDGEVAGLYGSGRDGMMLFNASGGGTTATQIHECGHSVTKSLLGDNTTHEDKDYSCAMQYSDLRYSHGANYPSAYGTYEKWTNPHLCRECLLTIRAFSRSGR